MGLNATPTGITTLTDNLSQSISINNTSSTTLRELAYSDKNLLGGDSNTVTGLSGVFGVAANLGGSLPDHPANGRDHRQGTSTRRRLGRHAWQNLC